MKVDADKIIAETISAFEYSGAADLYRKCDNLVDEDNYQKIHSQPLRPLDIKIDHNLFNKEILLWDHIFERWGTDHIHLPRFGAALVNKNGTLEQNDPINGSLMAWNKNNKHYPLLETDCTVPTPLMSIESLQPLSVLNGHWCRSNVLKWHKDAMFVPHIDTVVPSMWIRLWASMSPNVTVRFAKDNQLVPVDFEVGRLYVIDTSLVHDACATDDNVYQLFLSVLPSATNLIQELIIS